ncbi:MAG: hypothetical protein Q6351_009160 [Candidatus Njordarchaeum guaymaensis]
MKKTIIMQLLLIIIIYSGAIYMQNKTMERQLMTRASGGSLSIANQVVTEIWNVTWGGSNYDRGQSIFIYNNYVYITGRTDSFGSGNFDVFLLKYDLDGNLVWSRTWGGSNWDEAHGLFVYGNYICITGSTDSFGEGYADVFLLKYDLDGNLIWNVTWGEVETTGDGIPLPMEITPMLSDGHTAFVSESEMFFY